LQASGAHLYRAVDSAGETIEFALLPKRDLIAAKLLLRLTLSAGGPLPRVINVDGHPAYASTVGDLKQSEELGRHGRYRTAPYGNNIIVEQRDFESGSGSHEPAAWGVHRRRGRAGARHQSAARNVEASAARQLTFDAKPAAWPSPFEVAPVGHNNGRRGNWVVRCKLMRQTLAPSRGYF